MNLLHAPKLNTSANITILNAPSEWLSCGPFFEHVKPEVVTSTRSKVLVALLVALLRKHSFSVGFLTLLPHWGVEVARLRLINRPIFHPEIINPKSFPLLRFSPIFRAYESRGD